MILYGADLSSPVNKVRFTAHYLGIPYEYRRVSVRDGETRTPEFRRLHPAGKIPVIDDDGFILFESNAIIRYLADKEGSDLYPRQRQARALVDQWIDFISLHLGEGIHRILYNRVFAPILKAPVDEQSVAEGQKVLNRFLPIVENQLSKNSCFAGAGLTLADIVLLAQLDPAEVAGIDLSPYARISNWRNNLRQKDFYTKCYANYGEQFERFRQNALGVVGTKRQ